jgi:cellobiose-specific phosphotransferase system component IIC
MPENAMEAQDARATLAATARTRHRTRRALNPSWYANLVMGTFFAGSAAVSVVSDATWPDVAYAVLGLLAAAALIVRFYVKRERALGVRSRGWDASTAMFAALLAGVIAANALFGGGDLQAVMPLYAGAAGAVGFAVLWHDHVQTAAAAGLAAVATAVLVANPGQPGIWANVGIGLVLLAAGAAGRAVERR